MKSITKRGILALLAFTVITATSFAQPRMGRGNGPANGINTNCSIENRIPDLTEDQKAAIQSLRTAHLKEMRDFRNQMGEIMAQQRTIMSGDPIDQKAAGKLIDQKTVLMNKQMKARVAHRAAINEILTEEQVLMLEQSMRRGQFANRKGQGRQGNFYQQKRPGYGRAGHGRNF